MHDSHEPSYRHVQPQACIDELREALKEYLDWHETNFVLPSGNFEDPDQQTLARQARATLERTKP